MIMQDIIDAIFRKIMELNGRGLKPTRICITKEMEMVIRSEIRTSMPHISGKYQLFGHKVYYNSPTLKVLYNRGKTPRLQTSLQSAYNKIK